MRTEIGEPDIRPSGYIRGSALVPILFVVEAAVAVLSVLLELVSGLALDACGDGRCHYGLSTTAWYLMPAGAVVIMILSGILASVLRADGRESWWIPLAGIAAIALVFLITQWLVTAAINQLPAGLDPARLFSASWISGS
jgi:hypothetical protein